MHTSNHWKDRKWKEYSGQHSVGIRCLLCDRWTVVIDDDHTDRNILQRWHQVYRECLVLNVRMNTTHVQTGPDQNSNAGETILVSV